MQQAEQVVQTNTRRRSGRVVAARRAVTLLALAAVAIVVQGCNDGGHGAPLVPEKGVYQGPADEQLSQDQVDALRRRAARQQAQF